MYLLLLCVALFPQAYRGSVRPFVNFNAKQDAEILHKAMKGIGQFPQNECLAPLLFTLPTLTQRVMPP